MTKCQKIILIRSQNILAPFNLKHLMPNVLLEEQKQELEGNVGDLEHCLDTEVDKLRTEPHRGQSGTRWTTLESG